MGSNLSLRTKGGVTCRTGKGLAEGGDSRCVGNMQKPKMKVCYGFFAVGRRQMGAVGKRAKLKGRKVSNHLVRCFFDLRIKRLPTMNSTVWRPGGVCGRLPNTPIENVYLVNSPHSLCSHVFLVFGDSCSNFVEGVDDSLLNIWNVASP
jgi:hypothetical protein